MMSVQKNNGPIVDPALCRCCRAIKKCRILTAEYTWMGKKEIYADMVMDCYGILLSHVDDNERDSGVCATCVVRLREAIAFRHQVLQCEELFLQAKLEHHDEEEKDESRLKKFDLELKTEPKDYNSDHNSTDDRDDPCPAYSDDDADDNKPLKKEDPKPEEPPAKDDAKSEDSMDFNGESSSDSDEPIKKKAKRKAKETKSKANGAKKKPGKAAKKIKAETGNTETDSSEKVEENDVTQDEFEALTVITSRQIREPEVHLIIKIETSSETHEAITETIRETITSAQTGTRIVETIVEKPQKPAVTTEYEKACQEMEINEALYFDHYNMSKESFEELFAMMKPSIEKHLCTKKPIPARQRLAICLRRFTTGESCRALSGFHGIGRSTTAKIVLEVSKAIWDVLQPICMPMPTEESWMQCERDFQETFNLPNCVGSVGGRHVLSKMTSDKNEPSTIRSKTFSTAILIIIADAFYNITLIDIGNYGDVDEKDVFERTSFFKDFLGDQSLLPIKPLPNTEINVPQVFIGSEGMALTYYMLCEYPKHRTLTDPAVKLFNDRIHPARTVDRVFEMLMANWKLFRDPTDCSIDTSVHLTKAVCCLHNFVRSRHGDLPVKEDTVVRGKRAIKGLVPIKAVNRRATNVALSVRNIFTEYFSKEAGLGGGDGDCEVVGEEVAEEVDEEVCEEETNMEVEVTWESGTAELIP